MGGDKPSLALGEITQFQRQIDWGELSQTRGLCAEKKEKKKHLHIQKIPLGTISSFWLNDLSPNAFDVS